MAVDTIINTKSISDLLENQKTALAEAMGIMKTDLLQSQTIPFDTGMLQNDATFLDISRAQDGCIAIVSDAPYAARLYFHPEYNFRTDENKDAGPHWFESYISGEKKDFILENYSRLLKALNEGGGGQ